MVGESVVGAPVGGFVGRAVGGDVTIAVGLGVGAGVGGETRGARVVLKTFAFFLFALILSFLRFLNEETPTVDSFLMLWTSNDVALRLRAPRTKKSELEVPDAKEDGRTAIMTRMNVEASWIFILMIVISDEGVKSQVDLSKK